MTLPVTLHLSPARPHLQPERPPPPARHGPRRRYRPSYRRVARVDSSRSPGKGGRAVHALSGEQWAKLAQQARGRFLPRRRWRCTPQRLCQLVAGHRSPLCDDQVREQQPTLPAGETRLRADDIIGLERDPPREENSQFAPPSRILAFILPRTGSSFLALPPVTKCLVLPR